MYGKKALTLAVCYLITFMYTIPVRTAAALSDTHFRYGFGYPIVWLEITVTGHEKEATTIFDIFGAELAGVRYGGAFMTAGNFMFRIYILWQLYLCFKYWNRTPRYIIAKRAQRYMKTPRPWPTVQ